MTRTNLWGILATVSIFFASPASWSDTYDPKADWRTAKTPHFSLHYTQETQAIAQKVASYLEEAYEKLSPKLNWRPRGKIHVVLVDHHDDPNGAASILPYPWLYLRIAAPDPESALSNYDEWLKLLATHELTHILHLDANRGFWKALRLLFGKIVAPAELTPGWIREGLATLQETYETEGGRGRASYSEMLLRTEVGGGEFLPIDLADGIHWRWPGFQTQYIYGVKFLDYLVRQYGEKKLQEFNERTQRSLLLGAINHHAKKVYGKSFYKLWKDWRLSLQEKYGGYEKMGPPSFRANAPFLSLPTFSRDGRLFAYQSSDPARSPIVWLEDRESGTKKVLLKGAVTQMSFSPDSKKMAYSMLTPYKRYYRYYELYTIDLETKKSRRLKTGLRGRDPDFSSDGGSLVLVKGEAGSHQLALFDLEKRESQILGSQIPSPDGSLGRQFAHPRFSPDGKMIALIQFVPGQGWDLYVYHVAGKKLQRLTADKAVTPSRPSWSPDGRFIYYSADGEGISNIYRFDIQLGKTQKMTDVFSGAFQPVVDPRDGSLIVRYYHGEGYDLRQVDVGSQKSEVKNRKSEAVGDKPQIGDHWSPVAGYKSYPYSPFRTPLFFPHYILPGFIALDDALLFSLTTGSGDPLKRHTWAGQATYRTDASHIGFFGSYAYTKWRPTFGVGVTDYVVDFGNVAFPTTGTVNLFEERLGGLAYVSYPFKKYRIQLDYFYDDHSTKTALAASDKALLNLGAFAGFRFTFAYGTGESYPASISRLEKGRTLKTSWSMTDATLGSAEINERKNFAADWREFLPLGKNHLIALRTSGGYAFGDRIFPRAFTFGGSLGEGTLAGGGSSNYFAFRGLPLATIASDRVLVFSAEYRAPLWSPQRGLGTWPLFLNNVHGALFADYGDAWNRGNEKKKNVGDFFDDFFLALGSELRTDLVIGHGLPLTGRLGYGVVVLNRDRLGTVKDPLLGNLVKNGIFIMQWGTSF